MWSRRPSRPEASPLKGRYLVRNPLWRAWLGIIDAILTAVRPRAAAPPGTKPKRVLVCVGGHLGDAIIATAALSQLQHGDPSFEIGVLSGNWNREILASLPYVRWFHSVDHWKANRQRRSLLGRWIHYRRSRAAAVEEIRRVAYDVALDLYAYYPNAAPTIAAAAIPDRIGYVTGGFGPLYTRRVSWRPGQTIVDDHRALLETLSPGVAWSGTRYRLAPRAPALSDRVAIRFRDIGVAPKQYVVVHVGGGAPQKDWPIAHWISVANEVVRLGLRVVLTGRGSSDALQTRAIAAEVKEAVDLCDQLSWVEFRDVIAHAAMVFSVDTVAMHLAAADDVPCVAISPGIDTPKRWEPPTDTVRVLTHQVPCSPCYRSRGCAEMTCVRGVQPAALLDAARPLLSGVAP